MSLRRIETSVRRGRAGSPCGAMVLRPTPLKLLFFVQRLRAHDIEAVFDIENGAASQLFRYQQTLALAHRQHGAMQVGFEEHLIGALEESRNTQFGGIHLLRMHVFQQNLYAAIVAVRWTDLGDVDAVINTVFCRVHGGIERPIGLVVQRPKGKVEIDGRRVDRRTGQPRFRIFLVRRKPPGFAGEAVAV
jgi:hypothetical protein